MTRNTAIKLLTAMFGIAYGKSAPAQDNTTTTYATGAGSCCNPPTNFILELENDTTIQVKKGDEFVTITADEIWEALHEGENQFVGETHGANSPIINGNKGNVVIRGNGNKVEVGP